LNQATTHLIKQLLKQPRNLRDFNSTMASSLCAERKAILIDMMLRPVLQGGMGIASQEAAIKELQDAEIEVCDSLFQTGRTPDHVDSELVDLLICKKIYICCGTFTISFWFYYHDN
jgi:hypothetical protein